MRKVIGALLLLLLLLAFSSASVAVPQADLNQRVTELSQQISKEMTENQKRTIAVIEFADLRGCVTDFGRYLAEVLITRLYQTKKFKVIERQLLNKLIAEQKLSLTGIIDPASARQLGKLLGVDAIASGTVTDLAQNLSVNARLIGTETGEIFAVASTDIFKDESVMKLLTPGPCSKITPAPTPTSISTPSLVQKVEEEDFTFELRQCKRSGKTISCSLMITNNGPDRGLSLSKPIYSPNSRMFDNLGNEYYAEQRQIGGQIGYYVETVLISGVPVRAVINFEEVSPEATKIAVLEVGCRSVDKNKDLIVQFRNILITR